MNGLLLSNETLGDTLLSLRFFSHAKSHLGLQHLSLSIPEHWSGISCLIPGLDIREITNPEEILASSFDEVIDLSYAPGFEERVAPLRARRYRGVEAQPRSGIHPPMEIASAQVRDQSRNIIWQQSLEDASGRLDRLSCEDEKFTEAWLCDSILFPELKEDALRAIVAADGVQRAIGKSAEFAANDAARVLLLPGGVAPEKRLPEDFWLQLALHCRDLGMQCTAALGPNEQKIGFGASLQACCTITTPAIRELCQLMTRHQFAISHDCGLMHVACQAGLPTIALFSATNPAVWFPYPEPPHIRLGGCTPFSPPSIPASDEVHAAIERMAAWTCCQPAAFPP